MSATRCPGCGRFARYDAYYARFWCDFCDRKVPDPPPVIVGFDGAKYEEIKSAPATSSPNSTV